MYPDDSIFKIIRGDSKIVPYIIVDSNGDPVDLSSCSAMKFTVKESLSDSVNLFQKTIGDGISLDVPAEGKITVEISPDDTKDLEAKDKFSDYHYDLQYTIPNGTFTAYLGTFRLFADVADITTPTPTVNSYVTLAEAQAYVDEMLNVEMWEDATVQERSKALTMGKKAIDCLNYLGCKTDESQDGQFPRYDDTEVPDDIKFANIEIALALLDGKNPEFEFENLRMVSQGYSNVRSTYDVNTVPEYIVAGIPSMKAWQYLRPYLRDPRSVRVYRES